MFSSDIAQLSLSATLADLPVYRHEIDASALGREIQAELQKRPELPGVIVVDGDRTLGIVSRRMFFEQMSQPYSLELYLRRPARILLEAMAADTLLRLPGDCAIDRAVRHALNRPLDLLYEPIVMQGEDGTLGMLELNVLLLAQSQIFARLSDRLKKEKDRARQYAANLESEQIKVEEFATRLQAEQQEVRRRNQVLELQRAKLANQAQEIGAYNARFVRIGRLLSSEGKRTFSEMLRSVEAIGACTQRINAIGAAFSTELEAVDAATQLIERVSQQVRHLSIQAALVVNRAQDKDDAHLVGFSNITSEIGSLGSKTFEATNRVNQVASRFRFQIQELLEAARESETVARALVERSQQTQAALEELEGLSRADRRRPEESDRSFAPDGNRGKGAMG